MSENYVELDGMEAAGQLGDAWKHPTIPMSQFFGVAKAEIDRYRKGENVPVFEAAVQALKQIEFNSSTKLLDVGASTGHYGEIFIIAGASLDYTGVDYSEVFIALGKMMFPHLKLQVADARRLPFADRSFDIVLSAGCIMHIAEYEQALKECTRVSARYIILHRTPVIDGLTKFYTKEAYGVPCLEIHFGESDMRRLFADNKLEIRWQWDIGSNHRTYLLERA